jgi:hypothetical protein
MVIEQLTKLERLRQDRHEARKEFVAALEEIHSNEWVFYRACDAVNAGTADAEQIPLAGNEKVLAADAKLHEAEFWYFHERSNVEMGHHQIKKII